jgi:hypothetical protein
MYTGARTGLVHRLRGRSGSQLGIGRLLRVPSLTCLGVGVFAERNSPVSFGRRVRASSSGRGSVFFSPAHRLDDRAVLISDLLRELRLSQHSFLDGLDEQRSRVHETPAAWDAHGRVDDSDRHSVLDPQPPDGLRQVGASHASVHARPLGAGIVKADYLSLLRRGPLDPLSPAVHSLRAVGVPAMLDRLYRHRALALIDAMGHAVCPAPSDMQPLVGFVERFTHPPRLFGDRTGDQLPGRRRHPLGEA